MRVPEPVYVDIHVLPVPRDGTLMRFAAMLTAAEQERASRFHHPDDRAAWTAAHGLLRLALSERYPAVAPADWEFGREPTGRPVLRRHGVTPDFRFSLSHCRQMVACAVAEGMHIGVDVEPLSRAVSPEVVQRYATHSERSHWAALDAHARTRMFLKHWTLKEAYLKARGDGISGAALQRAGFDLGPPIRLVVTPPWSDTPDAWAFASWMLDGCHVAAAARHDGVPIAFRCQAPTPADVAGEPARSRA